MRLVQAGKSFCWTVQQKDFHGNFFSAKAYWVGGFGILGFRANGGDKKSGRRNVDILIKREYM